jgi:hypothetical protein
MMKEGFNPLNDFTFQKAMGEKGDEIQLTAFLNAVLRRNGKDHIKSKEDTRLFPLRRLRDYNVQSSGFSRT